MESCEEPDGALIDEEKETSSGEFATFQN